MAETENYDEVFKKFPYQRVMQGGYEIRRYHPGVLYTKWKEGKFDSFFYAIDGFALFEKATREHTMTEESGDESVFSYDYAVEVRSGYVYYGEDRVLGRVDDKYGDTIICEVNMYRDTKSYKVFTWEKQLKGYIQ